MKKGDPHKDPSPGTLVKECDSADRVLSEEAEAEEHGAVRYEDARGVRVGNGAAP